MPRFALLLCALCCQVLCADHPIDNVIEKYRAEHQLPPPAGVADEVFLRRATLDLTGLLPTPQQVADFKASNSADKRVEYVDALLNDQKNYADHWLTFWSDSLRNAYHGTGFIDNGRAQITGWLYSSLYHNKPYDQLVHELISPIEGSEGFTKGILWRGVVNESQRKEIQAAQNIAQVFLGTNLKCASCHDSFVNTWLLEDAYGMAAVFSDSPLVIHECNKPTEEIAHAAFMYPKVGKISVDAPKEQRMRELADLVVSQKNKVFAQTIVNRLWKAMLGRGLAEPVDNLDLNPPWSKELLNLLAEDFISHGYDLKRTLRLIATSSAYASATDTGEENDNLFRGPVPKRMSAEQYTDALAQVLEIYPELPASGLAKDGRNQGGQIAEILSVLESAEGTNEQDLPGSLSDETLRDALSNARWIWSHQDAMKSPGGENAYFRTTFQLERLPMSAIALVAADNEFTLYVNGKKSISGSDWSFPNVVAIESHLQVGKNVIAIHARNGADVPNAAGLIFAMVTETDGDVQVPVVSNSEWKSHAASPKNWHTVPFNDTPWKPAFNVAAASAGPWGLTKRLADRQFKLNSGSVAWRWGDRRVRAALLPRDDFQATLGRPNREQVVTERDAQPTLLQALELTNGMTLDALLMKAGQQALTQHASQSSDWDAFIKQTFRSALTREPTDAELTVASAILGEAPTADSIADFYWTIVMLPEFQIAN